MINSYPVIKYVYICVYHYRYTLGWTGRLRLEYDHFLEIGKNQLESYQLFI